MQETMQEMQETRQKAALKTRSGTYFWLVLTS